MVKPKKVAKAKGKTQEVMGTEEFYRWILVRLPLPDSPTTVTNFFRSMSQEDKEVVTSRGSAIHVITNALTNLNRRKMIIRRVREVGKVHAGYSSYPIMVISFCRRPYLREVE